MKVGDQSASRSLAVQPEDRARLTQGFACRQREPVTGRGTCEPLRLVHYQRRRRETGNFSIESLFGRLRAELPGDIVVSTLRFVGSYQ